MSETPSTSSKRSRNSPSEIPDPKKLLFSDESTSYSANMNKLFEEDEKRDFFEAKPESTEKPAKNQNFFTSTAFWKTETERIKVGVILNKSISDQKLYLVIYDSEKKVLKNIRVDDVDFRFFDDELRVNLEILNKDSEEKETISVVFIDKITFLRFAVMALIRSSTQKCFQIFEGSGNRKIDENSEILFDKTEHQIDDSEGENGLKLPIFQHGIKRKMNLEKIENHQFYKWIKGLTKGCHVMVKTDDGAVHEIIVQKERQQNIPEISPIAVVPPPEVVEYSEEPIPIERIEIPRDSEISEKTIIPTPVAQEFEKLIERAPESPQTEEIRDILHRIVGIELDRIEMRLNSKFEEFRIDVTNRLDRQTDILQQILENSKISRNSPSN